VSRADVYRRSITDPSTHPYPLDKEEVARLYYDERLPLPEVAALAGTSRQRLSRWMEFWGLPRRTSIESRSIFTDRRRASRPAGWIGKQWKHHDTKTMFTYAPDHPRSRSKGIMPVHVLVAEHRVGRYLDEGEVVHHLDGDRYNNSPQNLCVMLNREHLILHRLLGEVGVAMLADGRFEDVACLIPDQPRREFVRLVYVDLVPCATGAL
jgi:hypothetical protein